METNDRMGKGSILSHICNSKRTRKLLRSRYYTCPCYCDINHVHVRRENDKCKQAFQMAIQDSCSLYIVYHDDIHRVDSISYSEFSDSLSRSTISLTK